MTVMVDWSALLFKISEEWYKKAYGCSVRLFAVIMLIFVDTLCESLHNKYRTRTIAVKKGLEQFCRMEYKEIQ